MKIHPKIPRMGRPVSLKQVLEQRMLYDASVVPAPSDPAVTGTDATPHEVPPAATQKAEKVQAANDKTMEAQQTVNSDLEQWNNDSKNSNADRVLEFHQFEPNMKQLVFIDERLRDNPTILKGISINDEVHFLDMTQNVLDQMNAIIDAEKMPISAIRILSPGNHGNVDIGNEHLSSEHFLSEYGSGVPHWQSHLTTDANVTWYGYEKDAEGIDELAKLDLSQFMEGHTLQPIIADKEIVFVDTGVTDYLELLNGVNPNAKIVMLDGTKDAILQMSDFLAHESNVDAIHVMSHGSEGELILGGKAYAVADLEGYEAAFKTIGQCLDSEGDILLYGCDIASGSIGDQFMTKIADMTSADVAGSTDATGSAALGGDWELEVAVGNISRSHFLSVESYDHLLAVVPYTENAAAVTLNSGLNISASPTSVTVTINAATFVSGDQLTVSSLPSGISSSYNSSTGVLTLARTTGNKNALVTALNNVQFSSTSDNPTSNGTRTTRSFTITPNAGSVSGTQNTISVTAVNDAPVTASIEGSALSYTENAAATAITSTLTLSDVDSANLSSATVQITGNYQNGEDILAFTNANGITGSFNASTGTLTLSGSATVANYQAALRSVTYFNNSDNPSTLTRTVSFTVNDGALSSNAATRNITVTAVNDAPVVDLDSDTMGSEADAYFVEQISTVVAPNATLEDLDSSHMTALTATLVARPDGNDVESLSLNAAAAAVASSLTVTYDAESGVLSITGSASKATYQDILKGIQYNNTTDSPHTINRIVTFVASDGAMASVAQSATITITAITAAPSPPDLVSASDSGLDTDNITNNTTPTLTGSGAQSGATVTLYDTDGTTVLGTGIADNAGLWSITSATLSAGEHSLTVKQTDTAGNMSVASTPLLITIDTTPPPAPSTPQLISSSDSWLSNTDHVTNVNTPTLTGTAEANSIVQLFEGATLIASTTADNQGDWSITTPILEDGLHTITAVATNYVGNISTASDALFFVIDTVAPNAPLAPILVTDSGLSDTDLITNINTPILSGETEAHNLVKLYDGNTFIGSTTADENGTWILTCPALLDGVHYFMVTATDDAGNTSLTGGVLTVTIDTFVAAPSQPDLVADFDTGSSGTDNITTEITPIFAGDGAKANAMITLYDTDGVTVLGSTTADALGQWSVTSTTLSLGSHTLTVKQTDIAGNTSAASAPLTINVVASTAAVITGDTITELVETDTALIASGVLTSADVDDGAAFLPSTTIGALGIFTIDQNGVWNFTANAAFNYLNIGDAVTETFNVQSVDGTAGTVKITIVGSDDLSVITSDIRTIDQNNMATGNVLANDTDIDNSLEIISFMVAGDSTTYSAGQVASIAGGALVMHSDGSYSYTPDPEYYGVLPLVTYVVNTGSTGTLNVTVEQISEDSSPAGDGDAGSVTKEPVSQFSPATSNEASQTLPSAALLTSASFSSRPGHVDPQHFMHDTIGQNAMADYRSTLDEEKKQKEEWEFMLLSEVSQLGVTEPESRGLERAIKMIEDENSKISAIEEISTAKLIEPALPNENEIRSAENTPQNANIITALDSSPSKPERVVVITDKLATQLDFEQRVKGILDDFGLS